MTAEAAQLPHIEVFHRVLELPVIESAISKSAATYSRVKDCNQLLHWALTTAECSLNHATRQALPIAAPIARKLENPIHFVDRTLCLGLNKIEEKVPLVKEKPEQILGNAYMLAWQTVQPAIATISFANDLVMAQVLSLKYTSWNKVNEILKTQYGSAAVRSLNSTTEIINKIIGKYFPQIGNQRSTVDSTSEENKAHATKCETFI